MKKTLITLLALGGFAMADSDLTYVFTSTPGNTGSFSGWKGLTFNLDSTHDKQSYDITAPATSQTLPSSLVLDTIKVYTDGTNYTAGMKAILVAGDMNVLGVSSGATLPSGSGWRDLTFDFTGATSPVTLSTGTQYYLMWAISQKDNVSEALVGTTLTSFTQYTPINNDKLRVAISTTYPGAQNGDVGLGYTEGSTSNFSTPAVVISTHAVPEPATATLSLLALAGLATRRRRK